MAVHGRFKQPCPVCGTPVQRIRYATNECNYCATCQTGGRLLADRSLSRLLKDAWPKTSEPPALEASRQTRSATRQPVHAENHDYERQDEKEHRQRNRIHGLPASAVVSRPGVSRSRPRTLLNRP